MDIESIREIKKNYENSIMDVIGRRNQNFRETTGVSIKSINIVIDPVQVMGNELPEFVVTGCKINLEI